MKKLIPLLFLLNSCVGADYVAVKPYAGQGYLDFDRPVSQADSAEWGFMVEVGWDIGERAHIQRRELYNIEPPASPVVVVNEAEEDDDEPPILIENDTVIENIIPETEREGLILLYGSLGLLALMLAILAAQKAGIKVPFFDTDKEK